jgi:hypothetical protein
MTCCETLTSTPEGLFISASVSVSLHPRLLIRIVSSSLQIVAADMSDPQDLLRYDYLEYITSTTEYPFVQGRKQSPEQYETEAVIARFFTQEYLVDFLEKVLDGTLAPTLRSEQEELIAVGGQGQGESLSSGGSNSKNSNSDGSKDRRGSGGVAKKAVIKVVGFNFNAR